jgi:hypothetical protein
MTVPNCCPKTLLLDLFLIPKKCHFIPPQINVTKLVLSDGGTQLEIKAIDAGIIGPLL